MVEGCNLLHKTTYMHSLSFSPPLVWDFDTTGQHYLPFHTCVPAHTRVRAVTHALRYRTPRALTVYARCLARVNTACFAAAARPVHCTVPATTPCLPARTYPATRSPHAVRIPPVRCRYHTCSYSACSTWLHTATGNLLPRAADILVPI